MNISREVIDAAAEAVAHVADKLEEVNPGRTRAALEQAAQDCIGNNWLETMVDKQRTFQERLGFDFDNMTAKERTDFVKEFSIHATQEIHEMLYELPYFKGWKNYDDVDIDQQFEYAKEEFSDVMHFVLNMALGLGMTAEDIYNGYMGKNKINHKRQDGGY